MLGFMIELKTYRLSKHLFALTHLYSFADVELEVSISIGCGSAKIKNGKLKNKMLWLIDHIFPIWRS